MTGVYIDLSNKNLRFPRSMNHFPYLFAPIWTSLSDPLLDSLQSNLSKLPVGWTLVFHFKSSLGMTFSIACSCLHHASSRRSSMASCTENSSQRWTCSLYPTRSLGTRHQEWSRGYKSCWCNDPDGHRISKKPCPIKHVPGCLPLPSS